MSNFYKIQEALQCFDPESPLSLAQRFFSENEYMISWHCIDYCNFNCAYCGYYHNPNFSDTFSDEQISSAFDKTGKTWHIIITGGEPFLRKNFVSLCQLLTKNHYLSINTNLSQENVMLFADLINPRKIIMINAGIHIEQREKISGTEVFLKRFLYLQEKGFNIIASYVAYPPLLQRMERDLTELKEKGIRQVCAKTFYGKYQGKTYPAAYTEEEITLIKNWMHGQIDMPEYLKYTDFRGRYCGAGYKFFAMDSEGNLERCLSVRQPYGNFFSGNYRFGSAEKPCPVNECVCPYQGMLYSKNQF